MAARRPPEREHSCSWLWKCDRPFAVCGVRALFPAKGEPLEARCLQILLSLSFALSWVQPLVTWWREGNLPGIGSGGIQSWILELPMIQIGIAQPMCWDTWCVESTAVLCCNSPAFLLQSPLSTRKKGKLTVMVRKRVMAWVWICLPQALCSPSCLLKKLYLVCVVVYMFVCVWTGRWGHSRISQPFLHPKSCEMYLDWNRMRKSGQDGQNVAGQ